MNRLPTVFDVVVMTLIAAVFMVGCIQIGLWLAEVLHALASWVFP